MVSGMKNSPVFAAAGLFLWQMKFEERVRFRMVPMGFAYLRI